MSNTNAADDDKTYCETIAKSISGIIRFSLNEEFRKRSCELFGVFSTKDAEVEIGRRLMTILENKNVGSEKGRKKNPSKKKNKENVRDGKNIIGGEEADELSSVSTDNSSSQTQNTCQTNWLQISSQQCRKAVKRRQLQFYSQPHDFELSRVSSHSSNSQPVEVPSNSETNEVVGSVDFGTDFCRKRFRESFNDNSGKYLKKNLKYHRHIRF